MRLVSYRDPRVGDTWGCVLGARVLGMGRGEKAELGQALTDMGGDLDRLRRRVTEGLKAGQRQAAAEQPEYEFSQLDVTPDSRVPHLIAPIRAAEVWGCGVTYRRSADERDADAEKDIYSQVYESERPEIFFKATPRCCVGPNEPIGIRVDSALTAAEPELAVVIGADCEIIGYTICNDVSAWDIERQNPLYLPQSKTFQGCCALGPAVVTADELDDPYCLDIRCRIVREDEILFEGSASTSQLGRRLDQLVSYLTRNNPVPVGTVLTTGTGIMIPNEYALRDGDCVEIEIERIGVLRNPVRKLAVVE